MANPATPSIASSPIPPPVFGLPFVNQGPDGQYLLTPTAIEFLQTLWASIAGTGGVFDIANLVNLNPGATQGIVAALVNEIGANLALLAPPQNGAAQVQRAEEIAMLLRPSPTRFSPLRYGDFYDTTDQTAAVINTAYAVTFNTTSMSQGVYIGAPTSRIYVDQDGIYAFHGGAQFAQAGAATSHAWYWSRVNGVDVPDSASEITLAGTGRAAHTADVSLAQLKAGDYIEIMWAVDDINISLPATPAAAPVPSVPSVSLNVFQVAQLQPTG